MNIFKIEISKNRVFGLDILRAAAIFFVVFGHGINIFTDRMVRNILMVPVLDGVTIFFVLSGFLIGGILIKIADTTSMSLLIILEFWKRRWFRTLPNYVLILSITYLLTGSGSLKLFIQYLFFSQNIIDRHPIFYPEAWSLSVEEWFYILIPIITFFFLKAGLKVQKVVLLLILMILVTSISIRYYRFYTIEIHSLGEWDLIFRKQVITRLDSIMFGVLGAYINYFHSDLWKRHTIARLLVGIAFLFFHKLSFLDRSFMGLEFNAYYCVYSFLVSSMGTLLLLPFLSNYKKGSGAIYKIITTISLISYSMYLINYSLVLHYIIPHFSTLIRPFIRGVNLEIISYLTYWSVTTLLSIIIYKYYESRVTKIREKSLLTIFHNTANSR